MQIKRERVTPALAKRYLKESADNRRITKNHADSLTGAMNRSEWRDNGETIKFNGADKLIDGRHRMTAVVQSGRSLYFHVARGLDDDAFDTLDQGKRRLLADVLGMSGHEYQSELATAIRYYMWHAGLLDRNAKEKLSNVRGVKLLKAHPGLETSVGFLCNECGFKKRGLFSPGMGAGLHYAAHVKKPRLADDFWKALGLGLGLTVDSPIYKFRELLIANSQSQEKIQRTNAYLLAIKAWNCWRENITFRKRIVPRDQDATMIL